MILLIHRYIEFKIRLRNQFRGSTFLTFLSAIKIKRHKGEVLGSHANGTILVWRLQDRDRGIWRSTSGFEPGYSSQRCHSPFLSRSHSSYAFTVPLYIFVLCQSTVSMCVCMEASIQISCKIFYHQKPGSWVELGRLKIPQNHSTILQTFSLSFLSTIFAVYSSFQIFNFYLIIPSFQLTFPSLASDVFHLFLIFIRVNK